MLNACTDSHAGESSREERLDAVERELAELSAHIDAAQHRQIVLIGQVDSEELWAEHGARSCAAWLSWRVGLDPGAAREKVRVARALPELPRIDDAFRRGALSFSKVRALTRVADATNEEALLDMALASTAAHLEKICRGIRRVTREQGEGQPEERAPERFVRTRATDDGMVILEACLGPDEVELLLKAIDAARDVSAETSEARPARPDGLLRLAEAYLGGGAPSGKPPVDTEILVVVEESGRRAKADASEADDIVARLPSGGFLGSLTFRRLACDAGLVGVRVGADGEPLDVGRRRRTIPPSIRRALVVRHGGSCAFPGCTHDRWLHGHHIEHWSQGGETKLENLVLLCSFHHRLVHEGGFRVARGPDGMAVFFRPDGAAISVAPPAERGPCDPLGSLRGRHVEDGLVIDDETGLTRWDGRRPDFVACVAAGLPRATRAVVAATCH